MVNKEAVLGAGPDEAKALKELAIGKLLRISSRAFQEGDIEQYEECKFIIMYAGTGAI